MEVVTSLVNLYYHRLQEFDNVRSGTNWPSFRKITLPPSSK